MRGKFNYAKFHCGREKKLVELLISFVHLKLEQKQRKMQAGLIYVSDYQL